MCFQFIEVRIFGQVKAEVFGTAESIQISKYRVAFYFTRVLNTQVVGIGIHTFHFLLYFVGRVGEVDTVAQALTPYNTAKSKNDGLSGKNFSGGSVFPDNKAFRKLRFARCLKKTAAFFDFTI